MRGLAVRLVQMIVFALGLMLNGCYTYGPISKEDEAHVYGEDNSKNIIIKLSSGTVIHAEGGHYLYRSKSSPSVYGSGLLYRNGVRQDSTFHGLLTGTPVDSGTTNFHQGSFSKNDVRWIEWKSDSTHRVRFVEGDFVRIDSIDQGGFWYYRRDVTFGKFETSSGFVPRNSISSVEQEHLWVFGTAVTTVVGTTAGVLGALMLAWMLGGSTH